MVVVSYFNSTSNHNRTTYSSTDVQVVSYFNSTSNHNSSKFTLILVCVVSYFNSTSNHNITRSSSYSSTVVSYFNSTSNHNPLNVRELIQMVVSYFNSTSNHNLGYAICWLLFGYVAEWTVRTAHDRPGKPEWCRFCISKILFVKGWMYEPCKEPIHVCEIVRLRQI